MRRWNGWGDESRSLELPETAGPVLESLVGPGNPLTDATLEAAMKRVPTTRLQGHALADTSAETRVRHACGQSLPDWLSMRSGRFVSIPDAVAFPETSEQVQDLLGWAKSRDAIVVPYGGGTSVVGHLTLEPSETPYLTIAMTRMNKLLDLDDESLIATMGAGASGPQVEAQLRAKGLTLGHFPQSWELSTLGGWIVTRSSGQQSLKYGRIEQIFAGGRTETPMGRLDVPTFPASSAGPDMRELLMGSEGRFGILTEAKVRVTPLPERESFLSMFAPSWEQGIDAARRIAQSRVAVSMLRLSNAKETATTLQLVASPAQVERLEKVLAMKGVRAGMCMLTFGLTGSKAQVDASRAQLKPILRACGVRGVRSKQLGKKWEAGRFRGPYIREPMWRKGYAVDTFETALDWSRLKSYVDHVERAVEKALVHEGVRAYAYTHLSHVYGQGSSAYTTYFFPCAQTYEETLNRWRAFKQAACETIVAQGGTISHQHGVGRDHAPYLKHEKGELGMAAIGALARQFDPDGRLNPGTLI